ncbi:murein biosynthesis integral membrane protein MurJ [Oceanimonas sp. CHS3-5]|uniref:murein biosynthesis integral membrane protein MurJ n=1 Tax=Oceanimonas sp. CHS3-5 TaxID=3068186 RepID=UPI00273D23EC|nr:murein biosynthesis integral membrane protein MurJ [Oceanimonas sp. CHS3-5]MDP5293036.1 murein biosynthesis integral membrane protein MurJ [Oceanimonas sp. CHS3-5]
MSKALLRSGMIVSAMTLVSRVLGLVRDVVIANLMGAGASADVFFFANRIPNFLRRLFAEGAFNQAFVPVMTEYKQTKSFRDTQDLLAAVSGTLGLIVTLVTLAGMLGSGVVTALFGAGWFMEWLNGGPEAHKFELASLLLKITFPYLWFISFTAMAGAILNTFGKFAVSSFTPVFLNICIIAAALFLSPHLAQPEIGLAVGVFAGGLVQFLFQFPFLAKLKLLVRPRWAWHHPGVVKIRTLMIPALFGVSVSQVNLLFDTMLASFLATGSISYLYYSDRLLEFPLGLFGIAIATVILPALSSRHVDEAKDGFAATMDWGVRMVLLMGFPAMLGLIMLNEPMLRVLFMRGEFGMEEVAAAGKSLVAYGLGLQAFMLIKVLAPGYYARQDTKTPVRFGIIAMVANMVFNAVLIFPLEYVGLALATALSGMLNAGLLGWGLHQRSVYSPSRTTLAFMAQVVAAGAGMAALLWWLSPPLETWAGWSLWQSGLHLLGYIAAGALCYGVLLGVLGVRPRHFRAIES